MILQKIINQISGWQETEKSIGPAGDRQSDGQDIIDQQGAAGRSDDVKKVVSLSKHRLIPKSGNGQAVYTDQNRTDKTNRR